MRDRRRRVSRAQFERVWVDTGAAQLVGEPPLPLQIWSIGGEGYGLKLLAEQDLGEEQDGRVRVDSMAISPMGSRWA